MLKINPRARLGRRSLVAAGGLAALALAAALPVALGATSKPVVKTMKNKTLGKTILVTRAGMTLYRLSAEKNGKFICTDKGCLSVWHPLVVPRGTKPTGARSLSTLRRPDGRLQVAYQRGPLYTFVQDRKPGDVKGNGFKDVGVWRPVATSGGTVSPPATSGGGYGGGYGGGDGGGGPGGYGRVASGS
jgi:predicted lipoprotein with Yx(FWY)xxD motif